MLGGGLFADWRNWKERRRAKRDLRRMHSAEIYNMGVPGLNPFKQAEQALMDGSHESALQIWRRLVELYPDYVRRDPQSARLTLGLNLYEEAEALANAGIKRSPMNWVYAEVYAEVAERRGDLAEAIIRWARVRRRFPNRFLGYTREAECLLRVGKPAQAEELAQRAMSRFPDERDCWLTSARIAEELGNWTEALSRWNAVAERFPDLPHGFSGAARAMLALGRHDEAEAWLVTARYSHPLNLEIAVMLARRAEHRGDTQEAARRWEQVRERWPNASAGA